jgi:hypothetical protein
MADTIIQRSIWRAATTRSGEEELGSGEEEPNSARRSPDPAGSCGDEAWWRRKSNEWSGGTWMG